MSAFYNDIVATVNEMLDAELAQQITLNRPASGGTYDPATATIIGASPATTFTAMGVEVDYAQVEINGTTIKTGDRRVYIAPNLGTVPTSADTLTMGDGTLLDIIDSRPVKPALVIVLHEVQARGVSA